MTCCLYDARGCVGDLASIHGLKLVSDDVTRVTDEPQVKKFFEEGYAPITRELIDGFKAIHSSDKDIASTIDNLVNMLAKCDTKAIISDLDGIECPDLTIHRGTHEIGGSKARTSEDVPIIGRFVRMERAE